MTDLFSYKPTLMDKPLNPNGRFCRLAFSAWSFLNLIIYTISVMLILLIFTQFYDTHFAIFFRFLSYLLIIILQINFIYQSFIFSIRRLHDLNLSGWFSLLLLIPILNFLFFFYLLYRKGDEGMNKYGFSRNIFGWEKLLGQGYMIIAPLIIFSVFLVIVSSHNPKNHIKNIIFPNIIYENSQHQ